MEKKIVLSDTKSSIFVSFEGIDGSGKSTQVRFLLDYLRKKNKNTILVREPGGTNISEEIRTLLLKNREERLTPKAEALLMTASRNQLIDQKIIPSLNKGEIVIADRFSDSTLAYQGGGRGLNVKWLIELNKFATNNIFPDITFYLDIPPEEWKKRNLLKKNDRFENAGYDFQKKVRESYLSILSFFPDRIIRINGLKKPEEIHDIILDAVLKRIDLTL